MFCNLYKEAFDACELLRSRDLQNRGKAASAGLPPHWYGTLNCPHLLIYDTSSMVTQQQLTLTTQPLLFEIIERIQVAWPVAKELEIGW